MKHLLRITLVTALIIIGAIDAMAIEEAKYEVIKKDNKFEIRDYAAHILAETVVEGNLEDAGSEAFKRLFRYISGNNRSGDKVAMTAPVSQEPMGEKIKMTAPVAQQRVEESWVVSFMMPDSYTLETLPEPEDPKVALRQVPARRMAAVRYSGFWSEKGYLQHKVGTGVMDSQNGPYHCRRSHMGSIQPSLYAMVLEAERNSDSDRCRHRTKKSQTIAWRSDSGNSAKHGSLSVSCVGFLIR
jgi:hypothetical protein